jgi:hypothetical protein
MRMQMQCESKRKEQAKVGKTAGVKGRTAAGGFAQGMQRENVSRCWLLLLLKGFLFIARS